MEHTTSFAGWSFDDIVFLGRNKDYGAYQLRKEKEKDTLIGLFATIAIAGGLIGLSFIHLSLAGAPAPETEVHTTVTIIDPTTPPVIPVQPPPSVPPPSVRPTVRFVEMVSARDREVPQEDEPVRVEDIGDKTIGAVDTKGDPEAPSAVTEALVSEVPVVAATPLVIAEIMPEYVGGEGAMMKFIQNNISYPDMDRNNDVAGRVVVGFVVNEDGSLSGIKVIKGVSAGLDREAVRVVSMMPKFKPGRQQGKAVKVSFVLPIKFTVGS